MNLVLLEERDRVGRSDEFVLRDRRASHIRDVLRPAVGQTLRVGLLDGPEGAAEVTALAADAVHLRAAQWLPVAPRPGDVLVLAVPRPKVLRRMFAAAAALGFGEIHCTRSWRVDKSHLQAKALTPLAIDESLRLGLEQARRTHRPRVHVHPRFGLCLRALEGAALPAVRVVGHPGAASAERAFAQRRAGPFALATGPDGGFIDRELASLQSLGFEPIGFGDHPQRTEVALAVLWGQLDLARRRGRDWY